MENQIEIVKNIAEGMYGIGGMPNNEEFYAEFDMRLKAALGIADIEGRSEQLPDENLYQPCDGCTTSCKSWEVFFCKKLVG